MGWVRPFQENNSPKNGGSERKASGLGDFNFWNYLTVPYYISFGLPAKRRRGRFLDDGTNEADPRELRCTRLRAKWRVIHINPSFVCLEHA
jgi:hypothetical protein